MVHTIRPIPLVLGASRLSDHTYRVDFGRKVVTCTYVWYIEGPKQKILVDAGSDAAAFQKYGYPGRKDLQTLEEGLAKRGLKPEEIDIILITHLHFDHWLFAPKFPNAQFVIQKSEIEYFRKPRPYEARKPMADDYLGNACIRLVDGDTEICEGLRVLLTPGHTGGGQSVAVNTAEGTVIIDGLCGIPENFYPPAELDGLVPVLPSMIHVDLQQSFDSFLRIQREADIIVPLHDIRFSYVDKIP